MGIAPYKTFTFDGVSSGTYGVYLTGEGVFNAPERSVEMIQIAGRNGDYALDLGKFNNITVTYKAGMYDVNESNFATKIANLRNWLCSKVGYCRLSDDYNPNEYRMGVYASGLEVDHDMLIAGEFELTFNCKPQRFLTSGETKTTVTSGNTITNPTLFPSSPMLELTGYGDISVGGQTIRVNNTTIGEVAVSKRLESTIRDFVMADLTPLNTGDSFTLSGAENEIVYKTSGGYTISSFTLTSQTNCTVTAYNGGTSLGIRIIVDSVTYVKGTSSGITATAVFSIGIKDSGGTVTTTSVTATTTANYASGTSRVKAEVTLSPSSVSNTKIDKKTIIPIIYGDSTKYAAGNPMYIDLDIGECWNSDSGTPVSVNNAVQIPAELPTLPSGTSTITFDNTFTSVKVVPRWWIV